jgi:cellulose synthase (UDP-forming)
MGSFYFERFEDRRPPPPLPISRKQETLWHFLASANLILGGWYILWRWTSSLNPEAMWFAVPLAAAETLAYIGLILFTFNLWKTSDYPKSLPPVTLRDCVAELQEADRPLKVDIFITTYSEEEELVRLSIRDARRCTYPVPIDVTVHVLDDGRRPTMKAVAEEEGANYITRYNNIGFKAGNMRNAMEQTDGDFIVICDADTRLFPGMLENTLGYFRDPKVAFVQTPQWFYDLPEGARLPVLLERKVGKIGRLAGRAAEKIFGPMTIGEDPFANDPKLFYDAILRRRNWANAAFCCGAGSVHRREAVMYAAVRSYADAIGRYIGSREREALALTGEKSLDPAVSRYMRTQAGQAMELTPYMFHVSEDIYTSIVLHRDREQGWKSVLHPDVESKMLSPQDLLSWTIQRFKYAGGSLDIALNDNPVIRPGLTLPQRIMYAATFWSYLGALWNTVFLFAPLVYLYFGISPVSAYTSDFFAHSVPFLVANELAFMVATWGVSGYKGKVFYLATFPISLRAIASVLKGETIKFPVTPKDRQSGVHLRLIWPQIAVIVLTIAGLVFASVRLAMGSDDYSFGGLIVNGFWSMHNVVAMAIFVLAAFWTPDEDEEEKQQA